MHKFFDLYRKYLSDLLGYIQIISVVYLVSKLSGQIIPVEAFRFVLTYFWVVSIISSYKILKSQPIVTISLLMLFYESPIKNIGFSLFFVFIYAYIMNDIYIWISKKVKVNHKFLEPISNALVYAFISIFLFIFNKFMLLSCLPRFEFVYVIFYEFFNSPYIFIGVITLDRILWSMGVHGSNIINPLILPIYFNMVIGNLYEFFLNEQIPYLFNTISMDVYVYLGLFPIFIFYWLKNKDNVNDTFKNVIFNIGEEVIFGLPIVKSIYSYPFVISYIIVSIIVTKLMVVGSIKPAIFILPWTLPSPIKAFFASGLQLNSLFVILGLWGIVFLVFLPFYLVERKSPCVE